MTMLAKINEERKEAKEEGRLEGLNEGIKLQKKLDSELIASKGKALASKDREIAELLAKIDYYEKLEIKN